MFQSKTFLLVESFFNNRKQEAHLSVPKDSIFIQLEMETSKINVKDKLKLGDLMDVLAWTVGGQVTTEFNCPITLFMDKTCQDSYNGYPTRLDDRNSSCL